MPAFLDAVRRTHWSIRRSLPRQASASGGLGLHLFTMGTRMQRCDATLLHQIINAPWVLQSGTYYFSAGGSAADKLEFPHSAYRPRYRSYLIKSSLFASGPAPWWGSPEAQACWWCLLGPSACPSPKPNGPKKFQTGRSGPATFSHTKDENRNSKINRPPIHQSCPPADW